MDVARAWDVIHERIGRNSPEMRRYLNGPADPAALDDLEQGTGFSLPEDFKASYRIHEGSAVLPGLPYRVCRVLAGLPLLPLQGILRSISPEEKRRNPRSR